MAEALGTISMAILLVLWLGLLALALIVDGGADEEEIDWYYHHHW